MPAPDLDLLGTQTYTTVAFNLEPAYDAFNSLMLLTKADKLSGLDDWVTRTVAGLSPEQRHIHRVACIGLYYVVEPTRSFPSFPAYLDDLARQDPLEMRDRLFHIYSRVPPLDQQHGHWHMNDEPLVPLDPSLLLASRTAFLKYLGDRFHDVEEDVESEAHTLLNDPPKMKELIVEHLRHMWREVLEPEWNRVTPLLQACVDAFRQVDFGEMSNVEAAQRVIGQEPDEWWQRTLETAERVVFVPSAHVGPYLGKFFGDKVLYVLFGARQPEGVLAASADLSRSEMLVRLQALADDTRLRILQLLSEQGEQCSPDIIQSLGLSQSAASRHLQQLSATGYLVERRRDGAKCYSLNAERIENTVDALAHFLLKSTG